MYLVAGVNVPPLIRWRPRILRKGAAILTIKSEFCGIFLTCCECRWSLFSLPTLLGSPFLSVLCVPLEPYERFGVNWSLVESSGFFLCLLESFVRFWSFLECLLTRAAFVFGTISRCASKFARECFCWCPTIIVTYVARAPWSWIWGKLFVSD